MGIGPIIGVRPVTMVKPSPRTPDLSGVFAVEFRGQEGDESYSPSHQRAARGLEDEEGTEDLAGSEEEQEMVTSREEEPGHPGQVNFFA